MNAPTLYFLKVTERVIGGYEIWEQHQCQEKGCFWTDERYTGNTCLVGHIDEFVNEYENQILEGIIDEVVLE